MRNVHARTIDAPIDEVGRLLGTLGRPGDRLWPSPAWPPMRLDRALSVGAVGGHGPVRYTVTEYEPGRRVRFRFDAPTPLAGTHEFTAVPDGPERTVLTHVIDGRPVGRGHVIWPLVVRWFHDEVLEDLLDNAERAATGRVRVARRWSPWVRLTHRLVGEKVRRARPPSTPLLASAFDRVDYRDAYEVRLRPGMPADPAAWAREIFFHRPFPEYGRTEDEVLIGDALGGRMDFRVSVRTGERLVMSTVCRFNDGVGRRYFGVVMPFHRLFVRMMLRRAVRRVTGRAVVHKRTVVH